MNFDLGFKVLWPRKLKMFEIIFPFYSLITSSWEPQKTHDRLQTAIKLSRQFNTRSLRPNLIKNPIVTFEF